LTWAKCLGQPPRGSVHDPPQGRLVHDTSKTNVLEVAAASGGDVVCAPLGSQGITLEIVSAVPFGQPQVRYCALWKPTSVWLRPADPIHKRLLPHTAGDSLVARGSPLSAGPSHVQPCLGEVVRSASRCLLNRRRITCQTACIFPDLPQAWEVVSRLIGFGRVGQLWRLLSFSRMRVIQAGVPPTARGQLLQCYR